MTTKRAGARKRYPKYISDSKGKRYYHQGGDVYQSDDGSLLEDFIVLSLLMDNENASHGCFASTEPSPHGEGGAFGGAGAGASFADISHNSSADHSSDSSSSDSGSSSSGGDGGGGGD